MCWIPLRRGGECPQCHARVPAGKKILPGLRLQPDQRRAGEGEEISCASCGTALTQKTKFCPECGKKYNPCPNCGADLPEGAGACAKCGADVPTLCPSCGKTIAEKKPSSAGVRRAPPTHLSQVWKRG